MGTAAGWDATTTARMGTAAGWDAATATRMGTAARMGTTSTKEPIVVIETVSGDAANCPLD